MMIKAIFPTFLHQDPRYFNKGNGGFLKRTAYAVGREVITRNDGSRNHFNTSEVLGNAVAAGVSSLYDPAADRGLRKTASKWSQQISLDTVFNIMKEFWPDVRHKFIRSFKVKYCAFISIHSKRTWLGMMKALTSVPCHFS